MSLDKTTAERKEAEFEALRIRVQNADYTRIRPNKALDLINILEKHSEYRGLAYRLDELFGENPTETNYENYWIREEIEGGMIHLGYIRFVQSQMNTDVHIRIQAIGRDTIQKRAQKNPAENPFGEDLIFPFGSEEYAILLHEPEGVLSPVITPKSVAKQDKPKPVKPSVKKTTKVEPKPKA